MHNYDRSNLHRLWAMNNKCCVYGTYVYLNVYSAAACGRNFTSLYKYAGELS